MRLPKSIIIASLIWALLFSPANAVGESSRLTASADQLRALFVQRLVKYVTWPKDIGPKQGEPFIIAATNPHSLKPYFKDSNASLNFKLVQWPADNYHVLVLTGTPERDVAAIMKRTQKRPVLTIGQNPINPRLGVVVNFVMKSGKLRLQINTQAASRAGLTISSRLLKLAQIYKGGEND